MQLRGERTAACRLVAVQWLLISSFFSIFAGTSTAAMAQTYGLGTSPVGTMTYSAGSAIATVAAEKAGLQVRVQPYSGTTTVVPLLNSGEIDFSLINVLEAEQASTGTGVFKDHKNPNVRVVAVVFPLRTGIFVRKDSPIHTIKDLKGQALPVGYSSQAIIRVLQDGVLAAGGLTTKDVKGVPVPNIVRGADDFASGKADAFFFALGSSKVSEADASVGGIRMLPLDNTPEALAAMRRFVKPAYISIARPERNLAGVLSPTPTMSYDYLIVASAKASEDAVYKVTKALHDSKETLAATFGGFREFDPAHMAKPQPVEYHPGAVKFYKEIGQWPPKE